MSQSLRDFFPEEFLENSNKSKLEEKNILLLELEEYSTKSKKFIIIIGISNCGTKIGISPINTSIPRNFHKIFPKDYPFLSHESHIDCDTIIERKINFLLEYLSKNPNAIKGVILDDDYIEIKNKLLTSVNISKKLKMKYGVI